MFVIKDIYEQNAALSFQTTNRPPKHKPTIDLLHQHHAQVQQAIKAVYQSGSFGGPTQKF